jgi:hypothetical protein
MLRKLLAVFTALFLLPVLLLAQDGKLRGTVTDKESGEPLIGANVTIEGTSLGASSDLNGEYIILSVPPGTYTVKASYIGYSPYTISNIRISSNITMNQDFALSSTAIQVEAVEVVAQRPLIQRNTTNTVRVSTQEEIRYIPYRGIQNIVALEAGVVQQNGVLYIRGSRSGNIAFFVDGANTTNPYFNNENVSLIQEALEEVQLQTGGYTAELGGAGGGLLRSTMRSGGPTYKASLDISTDDFAGPGNKFLGTTSTGFRNIVGTVSGPVPMLSQIRFFLAGKSEFRRNDQFIWITPFKFENLVTDKANGTKPAGTPLPGSIEFKENYLYNNYTDNLEFQGKATADFNPFKVALSGSYSLNYAPLGGEWPNALTYFFNQGKNQQRKTEIGFLNARLTHILNPTTYYEIGISAQQRKFSAYDEDFGSKWRNYVDSSSNMGMGWQGRFQGPARYLVINSFSIADPNEPINSYSKNRQFGIGATVDFTSQINADWELKVGGTLDTWTIRNFSVGSIRGLLEYEYGIDGNSQRWNLSAPGLTAAQIDSLKLDRRVNLHRAGGMSFFGYDVDGRQVDDGADAPFKPLSASAYVQNKFEFKDLVLNFGLRYEYIDTKVKMPDNFESPTNYDSNLDLLDESTLIEREPFAYLLPRINFSFPVTDRTVFFAQYGKYIQPASLNQVYTSSVNLSNVTGLDTRSPYGYFGQFAGFTAAPERTTKYEVGIRQLMSDNFALTITGFYNDLRDQLLQGRIYGSSGSLLFAGWVNDDFGTTKGLELTFELRRTERLAAKVNYTLSDARGTGSSINSSRVVVSDALARYPNFTNILDQNQTHRGTVMIDYRFAKGDGGPVLEGMGLNLLLTFNSGHPYTKLSDKNYSGQTTPWNIGVRMLGDVRNRFPIEPINNSNTPWVFNVDLVFNKVFYQLPGLTLEAYVNVLNLFNAKHIINVYPTTGTAQDDGWLRNPAASTMIEGNALYAPFYQAINLDNRWAMYNQAGVDVYGTPRQIRAGIRIEY